MFGYWKMMGDSSGIDQLTQLKVKFKEKVYFKTNDQIEIKSGK